MSEIYKKKFCLHLAAANGEVSPKKQKQKWTKEMKKTAKPQVANYVDEEVSLCLMLKDI